MTGNVITMPLPPIHKMTATQLAKWVGKDPRRWAQAFLAIYEGDDSDAAMNEDWVTVWFEKAMEAAKL